MDCDVAGYHVESFNFFCQEGLALAADDVSTEKFRLKNDQAVEIRYKGAIIKSPSVQSAMGNSVEDITNTQYILPSECRQRGLTYRGPLFVDLEVKVNGTTLGVFSTLLGHIPIMLRSELCHLNKMSEEELIKAGEEGIEKGGYFVNKGSEKVIRLLVGNKRNFPLAIVRNSFKEKGKLFTEFGIMMRCFKDGHSAAIMSLHYLDSASMVLTIQYRRELFYIPFMYILRALTDLSDMQIYENMTKLRPNDTYWSSCVKNMLVSAAEEGVTNRETALTLLGSRFRVTLGNKLAPWETDEDAGRFIMKYCVAIHLDNDGDKFHCLSLMGQKLISLALGQILPDSPDNPQFQEATVTGHIFLLMIRERLEGVLGVLRKKIEIAQARRGDKFTFDGKFFQSQLSSIGGQQITNAFEYFLATGNLITRNGLGLMQNQGFAVIAERINQLRFVSHFRAIHRGAFFMETRTTDVRKLRPEAWGFICPVHTPDGAPCGLLNHVTASVNIITKPIDTSPLNELLYQMGVITHEEMRLNVAKAQDNPEELKLFYPVLMDGKVVGYVSRAEAPRLERRLRALKVNPKEKRVPSLVEIVLVRASTDEKNILTQFPGFYIFADMGRMVRPVKNLICKKTEFVGIFEQVYLSIIIDPEEIEPGVTMHQELHPSALFSFAGNLIPFPDHNQSPRNIYQCQMGKQTMGIAVHAWKKRADNKMYNIITPQHPLLKLEAYEKYEMTNYPLGTNACVAVISYTGYDMEDAMVINKSSFERGFAHGMVIKVERLNLCETGMFGKKESNAFFAKDPKDTELTSIAADGLPIPGRLYRQGDVYYSKKDRHDDKYTTGAFKYAEAAYCGIVRAISEEADGVVHILIQWRIPRNPIIGDKFASRHGQKGINSFLWPVESLPFSDSGMVPDIIFNPHGFPSRMTIGMMIESMAGKAAAMNGSYYDASPFVFNEENTAINHFGELLQQAGYNYYGNETMYSGVDGREMKVQIFFGIVYYQRLRHMIADKFQVRATGVVDPVTLQPVKGRKKGGGIRFGEMERDTMIAHGAAYCLQDRLLYSSDLDFCKVCAKCSSIISVSKLKSTNLRRGMQQTGQIPVCLSCRESSEVYEIQVPRVFRYLAAELSSVGIQLQCDVGDPTSR